MFFICQAHLAPLQLLQGLHQGVVESPPQQLGSRTRSSFHSSWHRLASSYLVKFSNWLDIEWVGEPDYFLPNSVFSNHCCQMMGQMRAGNPEQAPEERFASQLDQLASMGFVDRQANIQGADTSCSKYSFLNYLTRTHFSTYCHHGWRECSCWAIVGRGLAGKSFWFIVLSTQQSHFQGQSLGWNYFSVMAWKQF